MHDYIVRITGAHALWAASLETDTGEAVSVSVGIGATPAEAAADLFDRTGPAPDEWGV